MPRKPSCLCGECVRCQNRVYSRRSRERRRAFATSRLTPLRRAIADYCADLDSKQSSVILSELTGLPKAAVSQIRCGFREPTLHELDVLCIAIGLHPDLLWQYEEAA